MKSILEIIIVTILCYLIGNLNGHIIKKRQIFREQVLPHAGGKIPDYAFHTDRLALNRLQKEGIAVPDGVLLEQRMYQVHPHLQRASRPTFKVALTPENALSSIPGHHHFIHSETPAIDTTYAVPQQWKQKLRIAPKIPSIPVFRSIRFPTKSESAEHYHNSLSVGEDGQHYHFKHKIIHPPQPTIVQYHTHHHQYQEHEHLAPPPLPAHVFKSAWPSSYWGGATAAGSSGVNILPYDESYSSPQLFTDFDEFFNTWHSRVNRDDSDHNNIVEGSSKLSSTYKHI